MNMTEDLKAYVDGELDPARRVELEAAMEQDERLRRELEELRVLSRLIGDCVVQPEPVGLERALALLAARAPKRIPFTLRYAWALGLAGFVLLAMVMFPIFAQEKQAAKRTAVLAEAKRTGAETESAGEQDAGVMFSDSSSEAANRKNEANVGGGGAARGRSKQRRVSRKAPADENLRWRAEAPAGSPAQPASSQQSSGFQQMLIRSGDLSLRVASVTKAQADATNMAKAFGGYVEQSGSSADEDNLPIANVALRVPEKRFDEAMNRLRGLGQVKAESVSGRDVTAQVTDTEARLKVMRAEEESYVTMLRAARKVGELLEIKDRLSTVRQEIESLDATRKALRHEAAYSTISLTLSQVRRLGQKEPSATWQDETWAGAVDRASATGRWFAGVGMNLLVLAPFWIPVVGGLWWAGRRARRL